MPRVLRLRSMTEEELRAIQQLVQARTAPAGAVERARIIGLAHEGQSVAAIAQQLRRCTAMVRKWLQRFNTAGLAGLEERPRCGRPATYTAAQVSEVLACALTDPQQLGLPFASWTLDRLEAYLNEQKGILIKRSRIDDLLLAEGLRWRTQEGWFGARVDPDFARKRGRSQPCIPSHPPTA
jgi:transposase